jgi:hypothetical protein
MPLKNGILFFGTDQEARTVVARHTIVSLKLDFKTAREKDRGMAVSAV